MDGNAECAGRPSGWGRRDAWALALLYLLTAAHWLPRLSGPIDLRFDGGVYYVLGTALARGEGYRLLNEPGAIEAIQYPPLLPAAIALLERVVGTEDPLVVAPLLRLAYAGLSFLLAGLAYALARRRLEPGWSFLAAALPSFTFHTLFLEDLCFTEVPFTVVTLAFFLAAERPTRRSQAAAGLAAVAAFALRTAGVALLAAWAVAALLQRDLRAFLLRAALGAACVLAWQAHVASVRASPAYAAPAYAYQRAPYLYYNVSYAENMALLDPFRPEAGALTGASLAGRCARNAGQLWIGWAESVSAPRGFLEWPLDLAAKRLDLVPPHFLVTAALALLGLLVVLGGVELARSGGAVLVLYVLFASALVALLPWAVQVARYLAPLAPYLALALTAALRHLARLRRPLVLGLCALLLALQTLSAVHTFTLQRRAVRLPGASGRAGEQRLFLFEDAHAWRAFYDGLEWLRGHTPPEARIASTSPQLVWLHTGRLAVMPPFEVDPREAERLLDTVPVDYVVLDALQFVEVGPRYVAPVVRERPEAWELVHAAPDGLLSIYRRVR